MKTRNANATPYESGRVGIGAGVEQRIHDGQVASVTGDEEGRVARVLQNKYTGEARSKCEA